jgi:hypothetical protein
MQAKPSPTTPATVSRNRACGGGRPARHTSRIRHSPATAITLAQAPGVTSYETPSLTLAAGATDEVAALPAPVNTGRPTGAGLCIPPVAPAAVHVGAEEVVHDVGAVARLDIDNGKPRRPKPWVNPKQRRGGSGPPSEGVTVPALPPGPPEAAPAAASAEAPQTVSPLPDRCLKALLHCCAVRDSRHSVTETLAASFFYWLGLACSWPLTEAVQLILDKGLGMPFFLQNLIPFNPSLCTPSLATNHGLCQGLWFRLMPVMSPVANRHHIKSLMAKAAEGVWSRQGKSSHASM